MVIEVKSTKNIMKNLKKLLIVPLVILFACGGSNSQSYDDSAETETTSTEETAESTDNYSSEEESAEVSTPDIVTLAMNTDALSTLVTAVKAAGLVETLQGEGPFTVFAPTNDAFAALPKGTFDNLLKPENKDKLASILTYHVVAGKVMSSDLKDGMTAETVNGATITISLKDGAKVNQANVVNADVEASNGVVHVIDAVIMPPSK